MIGRALAGITALSCAAAVVSLADLVVRSAKRSPSRLRRMTGVLSVKSWMGLLFVHP